MSCFWKRRDCIIEDGCWSGFDSRWYGSDCCGGRPWCLKMGRSFRHSIQKWFNIFYKLLKNQWLDSPIQNKLPKRLPAAIPDKLQPWTWHTLPLQRQTNNKKLRLYVWFRHKQCIHNESTIKHKYLLYWFLHWWDMPGCWITKENKTWWILNTKLISKCCVSGCVEGWRAWRGEK